GNFTEESGYKAMSQFLRSAKEFPTAFFSANDEMLIGSIKAMEEAGYHVPTDFSLVGFDDIPAASYISPKLTTIHRPTYDLGSISAHILFSLINGRTKSSSVTLDVELVVRESTEMNRVHLGVMKSGT
ncbi:MAG: substrate-binding domain-containing protein, partial [Thermicanus sp.]|nr:substrate-binding domain-containing protein [Thermicanus sp.]